MACVTGNSTLWGQTATLKKLHHSYNHLPDNAIENGRGKARPGKRSIPIRAIKKNRESRGEKIKEN